ncbi:MAG: hypothetical protein Q9168_007489 [Polycauliona sp. 1 TL-2023]
MTGSLLRLCDKTVYGELPGRGRRIWQADQFRFRVVYTLPQLRLDPELWDEDVELRLHPYPDPEDWFEWASPLEGLLRLLWLRFIRLIDLRNILRRPRRLPRVTIRRIQRIFHHFGQTSIAQKLRGQLSSKFPSESSRSDGSESCEVIVHRFARRVYTACHAFMSFLRRSVWARIFNLRRRRTDRSESSRSDGSEPNRSDASESSVCDVDRSSRRPIRSIKSGLPMFEPTGIRSGQASWASFSRVVQDTCGGSLRFDVAEGDADRCPSDLPNVPMQISLRDVVVLGLMIGMRISNARENYSEVEISQLSMLGGAGHITFAKHSILGIILHFTPSNVDSSFGFPGCFTATVQKLWLLRLKDCVPVAGRAYKRRDREYLDDIDERWIPATRDFRPGSRRSRHVVQKSSREFHSDRRNRRSKHPTSPKRYARGEAQPDTPHRNLSASPSSISVHAGGSQKLDIQSRDAVARADGLDSALGQSPETKAAYKTQEDRLSSIVYPDEDGKESSMPDAPVTTEGPTPELNSHRRRAYNLAHTEDVTAVVLHSARHLNTGGNESSTARINHEQTELSTTSPNKSSQRAERSRSRPTIPRYKMIEFRPNPAENQSMADENHASKEPASPVHATDQDTTTKRKATRQDAESQERDRDSEPERERDYERERERGRERRRYYDVYRESRQTWKWLSQQDIMPAIWATPWRQDIEASKGAVSTVLEALSSLLNTEALQYVSGHRDASYDGAFGYKLQGKSTWPIYAINARDGHCLQEDLPEAEMPGMALKMPAIRLLYNYGWQTEKYTNRGDEESKVTELMMMDSWLSVCGRRSEITNGDSDLRRNMPQLVQFLFEEFMEDFESLHLSANEGGLQYIRPVAQRLSQRLAAEKLSPAEQLFALVAMLRTAKVALCICMGPNTYIVGDIIKTDIRVWLV